MSTAENKQPIRLTGLFVDPLNPFDRNAHWVVRLIEQGDRYGKDDILTYDNPDPLVEFFDPSQSVNQFGPLGQFVSRYNLDTLQKSQSLTQGLLLHTGSPAWSLSSQALKSVIDWAEQAHSLRKAALAYTLQSVEGDKMHALRQAQHEAAEAALASFDFGPNMEVLNSGGWAVTSDSRGLASYSRKVLLSTDLRIGDFSVDFGEPTATPTQMGVRVNGQKIEPEPVRALLREVASNLRQSYPGIFDPASGVTRRLNAFINLLGPDTISEASSLMDWKRVELAYEFLHDRLIDEIPRMKVIFSQSEFVSNVLGEGGFWNRQTGWGSLVDATLFMPDELNKPGSKAHLVDVPDAVVMLVEDADLYFRNSTDAAPTSGVDLVNSGIHAFAPFRPD